MNFKLLRFVSSRFAASNKRQRFVNFARSVALISVMLGSFALIVSLAVLDGFDSMLREKAVQFTSHISLRTFDNSPIKNSDSVIKKIKSTFKEVKTAEPAIMREGLLRSKTSVEGIMLRSCTLKNDFFNLKESIKFGSKNFTSNNVNEIIIGERLAKKMELSIGDSVVIYAIKGANAGNFEFPDIAKFRISAIYESGMAQYDDIYIYLPYQTASSFCRIDAGNCSVVEIILNDINKAPELTEKINSYLGYPFYGFNVFDLHRSIFTWIEYQKKPIPIVLGLISIVAVLNIITILLISVVEKTHSIGVLRSMGMNNQSILSIFVYQGLVIGLIGTLLGCGSGLLLCLIQQHYGIIRLDGNIYFLDVLPVLPELWHFVVVVGLSILLSFLATLIPAFLAVKITPIRAIRFK